MKSSTHGFTLVELVIVILIGSILTSITFRAFGDVEPRPITVVHVVVDPTAIGAKDRMGCERRQDFAPPALLNWATTTNRSVCIPANLWVDGAEMAQGPIADRG